MTLVARLFGFLVHHVIVARRPHGFALQSAEPTHISHEHPDLIVRNLAPERRHAVRPALHDRREDVLRIAAVDPLVVGQWRADPATAVRVTAGAIHLIEETLPL